MPIVTFPAKNEDISTLATLHLTSKKAAETNDVPQAYLDGLDHDDFKAKWKEWLGKGSETHIAELDGVPAGLVSFGPLQTPPPGTSKIRPLYANEIYAIYVDPAFFRKGVGKALIKTAFQKFADDGKPSACLWALKNNKQAHGFYEAMNAQRLGKRKIEVGGRPCTEICFGWRNVKEIL